MDSTLLYQIALPLLPEVGVVTAKRLTASFGSAEGVFRASKSDLLHETQANEMAITKMMAGKDAALHRAEEEMAFVEKHQIQTYYFEDENYPDPLRPLSDAPILLYGKGNIRLNHGHFVSIVGTRMPSDRGKQICHELVTELARLVPDLTIISGLAYGIDVTAHKAAIEAGIPTFIVPAHGLDRIYPVANRNVAIQSLAEGGILTEYMSGTEPEKANFVARNRIVAGLSEATIIIESKIRGGSLITARLAQDYGRDVFAFPGRPSDQLSEGCNWLIRNNTAGLVTCAQDIIDAMGWQTRKEEAVQTTMTSLLVDLSPDEEQVIQALRTNEDGLHINEIVSATQLSFQDVSSILFMLEMKGLIRALPGSIYRLS